MPPSTPQQNARTAKEALRSRYGREPWFRGVGITPQPNGLGLRLTLAPELDLNSIKLPSEMEGFPVEIVQIAAYGPR